MIPKKSMGQNFLTSEQAVLDIVKTANIEKGSLVLEVGPGKGVLTEKLLSAGAVVLAIEKDDLLTNSLNEKFEKKISNKKLHLENSDVLDLNFSQHKLLKNKNYKIVANIPYNITGILLRKIFSETNPPSMVVLMVQKEVAERIVARNKKESMLSISIKAYGEPKYIKTIKAGSFFPKPKVDSAIILIDKINKNNFKNISEKDFFETMKKGFSSKRKMLKKNLNCSSDILKTCELSDKIRAEDISLENWLCLVKQIKK